MTRRAAGGGGPARDLRRRAGRAAVPAARAGDRGPALGRRGDAGPRALPGAAASRTLPLLLVLSYREAVGADAPVARGARRPRRRPRRAAAAAHPAEPGGRGRAASTEHGLDPVDVHAPDGGQPVLRQPDPRPAGLAAAGERARRGGRPDGGAAPRPSGGRWSCCRARPRGSAGRCSPPWACRRRPSRRSRATGLLDRRGRGVAFRHEIARSAVLGAVPPGAEPALHASMIEALEAVGGDASVLAHHATAAGGRPADPALRARRGGRGRPVRARTARPSRSTSSRCGTAGTTTPRAAPPCSRPWPRSSTSPTGSTTRSPPARRRWSCAARSGTSSRSARATAPSRCSSGTRPTAGRPSGRTTRRSRSSSDAGEARALGYALANRAYLAAGRGDVAKGLQAGHDAQRIADELGDAALHTTASIGVALVRLSAATTRRGPT